MAHQVFIVLYLGLSFVSIGSKLIEGSLQVVFLLHFSIILFVFPVVHEVGEYLPFDLALLDFMKFVSIYGFVESSVPLLHVVDFHQLEMSLLHFLAELPYSKRSDEYAKSLSVQFSRINTLCYKLPIFVNFPLVPHLFETELEGFTE